MLKISVFYYCSYKATKQTEKAHKANVLNKKAFKEREREREMRERERERERDE